MRLRVSESGFGELYADEPKYIRIGGVISLLLGISLCFIGLFIAVILDIIIGVLIVVGGVCLCYVGMICTIRNYEIHLSPARKYLTLSINWRKFPWTYERFWDTNFLSEIEARQIQQPSKPVRIGLFFKYTNGKEELIFTELNSQIPYNCMKNINLLLQNKKVRKGTYRD